MTAIEDKGRRSRQAVVSLSRDALVRGGEMGREGGGRRGGGEARWQLMDAVYMQEKLLS